MINKCILLAAGMGTRLMPITNHTPKCLIKIKGKPLLEYWLELIQKHGITEVLINTHHLHKQVTEYIKSMPSTSLKITLSHEHDLLGSYSTVVHNSSYYKNDESILVANTDNLTNANLSQFFENHYSNAYGATIALFRTKNPVECGIVEMDLQNKIIGFEEKPSYPKSNLSNAGIYVFDTKLLKELEDKSPSLDIGKSFLPRLIGKSSGYFLNEFLLDIGSHTSLKAANKLPIEFLKDSKSEFSL